ncbi:MAG: hypothetical protein WCG25_01485 [bacterium]
MITYSHDICHCHLPSIITVSNLIGLSPNKTTSSYISITVQFFNGIKIFSSGIHRSRPNFL